MTFSAPVGSEATAAQEEALTDCVDAIRTALTRQNYDTVKALAAKASALLSERNQHCNLYR